MHSRIFLVSRRIALMFGVLLVLSLAGACGTDSNSDANNNGEGNGGGASGGDSGITLTYEGDKIKANTSSDTVNAMFVGALKKFNVTIMAGWADADSDPSFGVITTRLNLVGDSETEVKTGTYTLEEDTGGSGILSGPMTAAFVIEKPRLGLPDSLAATSGTFKVNSLEFSDKKVGLVAISFDGTFKNASDDSDTKDYKLTGTIDVPKD